MCKLLELPTSILKEEEEDEKSSDEYCSEGGESEMSEVKEIIKL